MSENEYVVAIVKSEEYTPVLNKITACSKAEALGMVLLEESPSDIMSWSVILVNETLSLDSEIKRLVSNGRRIEAIKLYRGKTGKDLKESKNYVDTLCGL